MGRRIDDHGFWAGGKPKGYVFPESAKMKSQSDAAGDGHVMDYPDTQEKIYRDQEHGVKKAKAQPMKPGYRY